MSKLFILIFFTFLGCSEDSYRLDTSNLLIDSSGKETKSTSAGNLIATAMLEVHDLDVVLYPSQFLRDENIGVLTPEMSEFEQNQLVNLYPKGRKDEFIIGRMKGKDLKSFIKRRCQKTLSADFQVAGITYDISLMGGIVQYSFIDLDTGSLNDKDYYKVAVSYYEYDYRSNFPGYFYGDSLSHSLNITSKKVSARDSLLEYFKEYKTSVDLLSPRARVKIISAKDSGTQKIYNIQSNRHRTPFYGHKVKTSGIVTAIGYNDRGIKGTDLYLQDPQGDGNDETSDAIHVFTPQKLDFSLGDEVEIAGEVIEQMSSTGLSRTSLQNLTTLKVISKNNPLPKAVVLGVKGRRIPSENVSTYRGDLNLKPYLNLNDAIDFWESLEGMRVQVSDLRVLGFRGGQEEFEALRPKDYLNLYVSTDFENYLATDLTLVGGMMSFPLKGDFNAEIIQLQANHLSRGFDTSKYFNVGDTIPGDLEGVLTYEMNIFGSGEWAIVLPEPQKALEVDFQGRGKVELEDRPKVSFSESTQNDITIATYNVENLAGNQETRIKEIARSIEINLACPDIVNLVEIQDNNGIDFTGGSTAQSTLTKLIQSLNCPDNDYREVNQDPLNHNEGGQPGGNIRVSMIYNANKLSFNYRPTDDPLAYTRIDRSGNLNFNPGRVFARAEEFKGTRKSLVAQFDFQGTPIFVIGNHFNSKLGDSSPWSNVQPVYFGSQERRMGLAKLVNQFVQMIENEVPNAHIVVLGDFNAYLNEAPMRMLEGNHLVNLMKYDNLIVPQDRYTTNFNGSSQSLDYIFANKNFLTKKPEHEVLHLNSDYMGRLSDHDPLVVKFSF